jgi:uncharacterized protein (TIGR02594 family)
MLNRRTLLFSIAASAIPVAAVADSPDWESVLQKAIDAESPLTLGHVFLPPDDKRWAEVDGILDHAPGKIPYDVAAYFINSVPAEYQQAWPEPNVAHPTYANPLITRLFLATDTAPSGDTTPWCAAFVNWCLTRAKISGTHSANSQVFLRWGNPVWQKGQSALPTEARTGDVAVFRLRSDIEHGHVAFFKAVSTTQPQHVEILGGNQIRRIRQQRLHLIDVESLRVDGELELVAVRTMPGLRNG